MVLYHITSKYKSGRGKHYCCNVCNQDYFYWDSSVPDNQNIYCHLIEKHPDSCYKCNICDKLYINKESLKDHIKNEHPKTPKKCDK